MRAIGGWIHNLPLVVMDLTGSEASTGRLSFHMALWVRGMADGLFRVRIPRYVLVTAYSYITRAVERFIGELAYTPLCRKVKHMKSTIPSTVTSDPSASLS